MEFGTATKSRARLVFGELVMGDDNDGVDNDRSINSLTYSPSPVPHRGTKTMLGDKHNGHYDDNNGDDDDDENGSSVTDMSNDGVKDEKERRNESKENARPTTKRSHHQNQGKHKQYPSKTTKTQAAARKVVAPPPAAAASDAAKPKQTNRRAHRKKQTADAVRNAVISVNNSLNAAKQAKVRSFHMRATESRQFQQEWKEDRTEAQDFFRQAEKGRRDLLKLQKQLSSKFLQAKASKVKQERDAHTDVIMEESKFKSSVFREQQEALKRESDRRRRESIQAREKVRANHRDGEQRMRLNQIREDMAVFEERQAASRAKKQFDRDRALERRKSFQFRAGDAKRIRDLHARMESDRMAAEHKSYALKWDGERDAAEYEKAQQEAKRLSVRGRNKRAFEQREEAKAAEEERLNKEHASFELTLAADRDARAYKKRQEENRRKSHAFRNADGSRQRVEEKERREDELAQQHRSYETKWAGERDANEHMKKLQEARRQSTEARNREAWENRKRFEAQEDEKFEQEHQSYELKWLGEKDVESHRRAEARARRESTRRRNEESVRHAHVMDELRSLAQQKETESLMLKWDAERDVQQYKEDMAEQRRRSLRNGNREAKRQRDLVEQDRQDEIHKAHQDETIKALGKGLVGRWLFSSVGQCTYLCSTLYPFFGIFHEKPSIINSTLTFSTHFVFHSTQIIRIWQTTRRIAKQEIARRYSFVGTKRASSGSKRL